MDSREPYDVSFMHRYLLLETQLPLMASDDISRVSRDTNYSIPRSLLADVSVNREFTSFLLRKEIISI